MKKNSNIIGAISLGLSCFTLLLAIFPPCILEKKILELERIREDTSTAFSFELNLVTPCSCEDTETSYITEAEAGRMESERLCKIFRILTLTMILFAVSAVFTAVYSWIKEHGKEICIWSIITAAVALSWQYVGMGLAVSTALFIFIMLTVSFG